MSPLLADILLPVPIDHAFTYLVPPPLQAIARRGSRALVPFGRKYLTGVIVGFPEEVHRAGLKPIRDILDASPTFSEDLLTLTRWIAEYYLTPWGEVLRAAAPPGLALESRTEVLLRAADPAAILESLKKSASKQRAILLALQRTPRLTVSQLQKKTRSRSIRASLHDMASRGWIELIEQIGRPAARPKFERIVRTGPTAGSQQIQLTEKQSALYARLQELLADAPDGVPVKELLKKPSASLSVLQSLVRKGVVEFALREVHRTAKEASVEPPPSLTLNEYQRQALEAISRAIDAGTYHTFLLHGVTGSGKTQVYIEAIRKTLERGKTAIVLVPEIALTPQTVRRFKAHFGDDVAVMHSQMSAGERFDAWRLAQRGRVRIVIGPRSAIFAPLQNLGLIVVDEEQEASYKQFDAAPRYNARDVAIVRASNDNAVAILGSATPSSESYYNALSGKYTRLEMPERVDEARLPTIEIVDMRKERKTLYEELQQQVRTERTPFPKRLPVSTLSRLLRSEIAERLEKKEGVILLQNRRGFAHVVECFDCGYVEKCDNCEVTLTFHATKKHLRCHYCGFVKSPPAVCPQCGGIEIRHHAFGTQQVHEELQSLFPDATIFRMDLDTTSRKGAHDRILQAFGRGEADVLLGTQMVAKGLDFPRVTLVGVVSADTQMLLPDFRAAERTFQLLTQVAGRAGRAQLAGEVIIQTRQPDHYCLKHVVRHDFPGFYREELEYRKELDYPPFSRIVLLEFRGARENEVHHHARKFAEYLTRLNVQNHSLMLGPADAAIPKVKNQYRKHVILKNLKSHDPSGHKLRATLIKAQSLYAASPISRTKRVEITIDVDPVGMM